MTLARVKIGLRVFTNGAVRAQGVVPRGSGREVCAFLKLVELEVRGARDGC